MDENNQQKTVKRDNIMTVIYYLRKLVPNIDLISDKNREVIIDHTIDNVEKVIKVLSNYFNDKKSEFRGDRSIEIEADYINQIFSSIPRHKIIEQLELFQDMPQRIEIVLRLIVQSQIEYNKDKNSDLNATKRSSPTQTQEYFRPKKFRKVNEIYTGRLGSPSMNRIPTPASVQRRLWQSFGPPRGLKLGNCTVTSASNISNVQILNDTKQNCDSDSSNHVINVDRSKVYDSTLESRYLALMSKLKKPQKSTDIGVPQNVNTVPKNGQNCTINSSNDTETIVKSSTYLDFYSELDLAAVETTLQTSDSTSQNDETSTTAESEAKDQNLTENEVGKITTEQNDDLSGEFTDSDKTVLLSPHTINQLYGEEDIPVNNDHIVDEEVNAQEIPASSETNKFETVTAQIQTVNNVFEQIESLNNCPIKQHIANNIVIETALPLHRNIAKNNVNNIFETVEVFSNNVTGNKTDHQCVKEIPSSSKQPQQHNAAEQFDLVEYLHEVTKAPTHIIYKLCKKFNVPTWIRPHESTLAILVDNLLTNEVPSESSNSSDDSDDVEEVKAVSTFPQPSIITVGNVGIQPMVNVVTVNMPIYQTNKKSNKEKVGKGKMSTELTNEMQSAEVINVPLMATEVINLDSNKPVEVINVNSMDSADAINVNSIESTDVININSPMLPETIDVNHPSTSTAVNTQLVSYLCGLFPDACPDYIKGLCKNKPMNDEVVDSLTSWILSANGLYPKRPVVVQEPEVYPENQLEILKELLPDADPDYLRMKCDEFEGNPEKVKSFINEAMERRNYPTLKEYQRRQQLSAQERQLTTEFNVENFIKVIPDPHKFFSDPSRVVTMDAWSSHYALIFLRNTFTKLSVRVIQSTFTKNNENLSKTYSQLQKIMSSQSHALMKSKRKIMNMPNGTQNIPLLQEIAYYSHLDEINEYLKKLKDEEESEKQEALSKGLLQTCNCCYDEEVLPKNIFKCENGCAFCKSCIVKSTEVRFGEGKLDFPCLMNCSSHFTLQTLQAVLSPKLFSKIAQKKAVEEVKAAGIEELETCPFCDFATIPAEGYTIFTCYNPDCMKESCRLCKEPSHIPLKCDEIEKDEDVKARTFVENKMTEALLKTCWKCGIKFFKEEGCNKMTCSCGASMCYVCGQPVKDYKHFNGNGGDRFDLCPLYSDTLGLNKDNVRKAAEQAKAEIGNKDLKNDPTKDLDKHYKERAKKFPHEQRIIEQQRQAQAVLLRMQNMQNIFGDRHNRRHHHRRHQPF